MFFLALPTPNKRQEQLQVPGLPFHADPHLCKTAKVPACFPPRQPLSLSLLQKDGPASRLQRGGPGFCKRARSRGDVQEPRAPAAAALLLPPGTGLGRTEHVPERGACSLPAELALRS